MVFSRIVKRVALLAGVVLVGVTLAACGSQSSQSGNYKDNLAQSGKLTIGLEGTYPPYSYRQNGKLTGFEVELGKAIAQQLDLKANFVPTKWDGLVAGLGSGKYDIILNNMSQTPDRKKAYLFSTPYIYSKYAMITRSDNKDIKTAKDIKGRNFVASTGSDNGVVIKKFGGNLRPIEQFQTELDQIREGRADGAMNAESAITTYAKDHSLKGLKYHVLTENEQPAAKISALFNKQDGKLRDKVNDALKQLKENGTLKKLSVKYFGTDITTK
ncbi:L-cystine ABC superfamily ATP binding cassette transporter, binding protein YckK [Secundilactobacillus kimchicus JCM 15530]|uniref:L-cystine ABC superfamily ATP binding cassette transporter, binding protein YckK n=1 Tax=Secundilactobacillus kimchicus JCM 15530 TaxID=1302272 RepID=A0A0R1HQ40_9LACO|nr:transporter substrate-binding domain-containing protein [Secundilactobacillus kimchicus]KRK48752.1 L-cystine ABC superfamily ATP binding cassette transporter, binding protein YckK [Secundilactobacillus kimchicus JCM 15530]